MFEVFKKLKKRNEELKEKGRREGIEQLDRLIKVVQGEEYLGAKETTILAKLVVSYGVYPSVKVDYLGGSPFGEQPKAGAYVMTAPNGIVTTGVDGIGSYIPYDSILDLSLKTREQIQRDVTLTRLLAFGMYGFAMKKETKKVHQYLTIKVKASDGDVYTMLLAGDLVPRLCNNIKSAMKESVKLEKNGV